MIAGYTNMDIKATSTSPCGVEGMRKGCHFVKNTAECPYVGLVVVRRVLEEFWRHVVGRADPSARQVCRTLQDLRGLIAVQLVMFRLLTYTLR